MKKERNTKKRIRLKEKHVKYLANLPESGMGYQIVNVFLSGGQKLINRIVLNAEFLVIEDNENINVGMIESIKIIKEIEATNNG